MTWFSRAISAAGLAHLYQPLTLGLCITSLLAGAEVWFLSEVPALGVVAGGLALAGCLETIRVLGESREKALETAWPAAIDMLRSGSQAGLSFDEQLGELAERGPRPLRHPFTEASQALNSGCSTETVLAMLRRRIGSRSGDLVTVFFEVFDESGRRGEDTGWQRLSGALRTQQATLALARSKQGWVSASAKLALLAPWLLAAVLLRVEENKIVYQSFEGTLVLLGGLLVSALAYFLTIVLGRLPKPERTFCVGS
jgi:tight adherence protein B